MAMLPRHADIAAALQEATNAAVVALVRRLKREVSGNDSEPLEFIYPGTPRQENPRATEKRRRIITEVKGVNRVVCGITSPPPVTAREHDVGADREPEGVIADKRYLDEHAKDRKDRHYERQYNRNVHRTDLLARRRSAKNRAGEKRSASGRALSAMTRWRRSSMGEARQETPRSANCNPNWRVAKSDHSSIFCALIPR
jgi:hypothetical protein